MNEQTLHSTSMWSVDREVMKGVPWTRSSILYERRKQDTKMQKRKYEKGVKQKPLQLFWFSNFVCQNLHSEDWGEKLSFCSRRYNISSSALGGLCRAEERENSMGYQHVPFGFWSNLYKPTILPAAAFKVCANWRKYLPFHWWHCRYIDEQRVMAWIRVAKRLAVLGDPVRLSTYRHLNGMVCYRESALTVVFSQMYVSLTALNQFLKTEEAAHDSSLESLLLRGLLSANSLFSINDRSLQLGHAT